MKVIHLNSDLIARLDEAEAAFFGDLSKVTNECHNSDDCKLIELPGARAFVSPKVNDPLLNRVIISGKCDAASVFSIVDEHFAAAGGVPVEISPGALEHELSVGLHKRGYAQTEFLPVLVNYAENIVSEAPKLRISKVESESELSKFKELLIAGWTIPPAQFPETLTSSVEKWINLPGWTLLLSYDGDEAVSCGILHCHKGVAFLAVSATPPQFRGRGGQSAIDRARVAEAIKQDAELIWSRTYFASVSQRNKEKFGLNVLYLRSCWTKVE